MLFSPRAMVLGVLGRRVVDASGSCSEEQEPDDELRDLALHGTWLPVIAYAPMLPSDSPSFPSASSTSLAVTFSGGEMRTTLP